MSRLESAAKPVLAPLIQGAPRSLGLADQHVIGWWSTKTAMTLECASAGTRRRYFTQSECAAVAEGRVFPGLASVWLGRLQASPVAASAEINDLSFQAVAADSRQSCAGFVATLSLGFLVIQALFIRVAAAPGTEVELAASGDFAAFAVEVWPALGAVTWPPAESFVVDDLRLFSARWSSGA
jgi:hypothetical protein